MMKRLTSRRAVVGAAGIGTAAVLVSLIDRSAVTGGSDRGTISIASGNAGSLSADGFVGGSPPGVPAAVAALVDTPIRITGDRFAADGRIVSVQPIHMGGKLPAGVRTQPFRVNLAVDAADAPRDDGIYDIGMTIEGLSRVFVRRGTDVAGKALMSVSFA